jgi:hypothetical protein
VLQRAPETAPAEVFSLKAPSVHSLLLSYIVLIDPDGGQKNAAKSGFGLGPSRLFVFLTPVQGEQD